MVVMVIMEVRSSNRYSINTGAIADQGFWNSYEDGGLGNINNEMLLGECLRGPREAREEGDKNMSRRSDPQPKIIYSFIIIS